ncbi:hypothetical protein SAMN05444172_2573 [Burkholderia sp. GAS332]|nr:hypothetical protein SAMN05444172_2573 [Burkholderia sp. GAS332]
MTDAVAVANWGGMQVPMQQGTFNALDAVWINNQANADKWTQAVLDSQNASREQHAKDVKTWADQQDKWQLIYSISQAAYAAAQTLLANNALEAATDAADKQYDIANRQQTIAETEYARYSAHFAPCENATIDEECARPEYTEPIEDEANRAAVDVRAQFAISRQQLQRRRSRYCVGAVIAQERTFAVEEARAVAEGKERARRFLEERQESRRDKYFNRKLQMFNIGRGIKADAVGEFGQAAQGIARGTEIELAGRNQYYGAILSSLGGLMGAILPNSSVPQASRSAASIGGVGSYGSVTNFGGAPMMGPGGLGYGYGAFNSSMSDTNMLGPQSTFA